MKQEMINRLSSIIDSKIDKYTYNYARYLDDITAQLRSTMDYNYGSQASFARPQDPDLSKPGSLNVVRSCIDTLVSRLASNKVRPYIHPVAGHYKSQVITRQARQYFDILYDKLHVNDLIMEAFRDACIFDTGYIFLNPFNNELLRLPPYTVGLFNMEKAYGDNRNMLIKLNNYPTTLLPKKWQSSRQYCQYCITVSLDDKKAEIWLDGEMKQTMSYVADQLPIISMYFSKPVVGNRTYSLADALEGCQEQIDMIASKMGAAAEGVPGNTTYVVEGSSVSPMDVNNRTGNVYGVKMPEGSTSIPVLNVAPAPMDPMWQQLIDYWKQSAYDLTGISQLSAEGTKPAGIDSGAAMATLEDIESARFQTQFDNYIQAYKDLAKLIIKLMPDDCPILPKDMMSSSYTWADLKKDIDCFKINFAADTAISKDPVKALQQIGQISNLGGIDINILMQQMDSTDLETAYRDAAAKENAIDKCIERAIEEGDYTVPEFVSYQDLYKRIMIVENQLYASLSDDNKANQEVQQSLLRLQTLESVLSSIMEENGYIQTENPEEPMTTDDGTMTATGSNEIATDLPPQEQQANVEGGNSVPTDMAESSPTGETAEAIVS